MLSFIVTESGDIVMLVCFFDFSDTAPPITVVNMLSDFDIFR